MRLAIKLGVSDVDALMDSMTTEQLSEMAAVAIIDGWYNGWSQTAEIIAAIRDNANRQLVARAAKPQQAFDAMDWRSGQEIAKLLTDYSGKQKKKKHYSPRHAAKIAQALYG